MSWVRPDEKVQFVSDRSHLQYRGHQAGLVPITQNIARYDKLVVTDKRMIGFKKHGFGDKYVPTALNPGARHFDAKISSFFLFDKDLAIVLDREFEQLVLPKIKEADEAWEKRSMASQYSGFYKAFAKGVVGKNTKMTGPAEWHPATWYEIMGVGTETRGVISKRDHITLEFREAGAPSYLVYYQERQERLRKAHTTAAKTQDLVEGAVKKDLELGSSGVGKALLYLASGGKVFEKIELTLGSQKETEDFVKLVVPKLGTPPPA